MALDSLGVTWLKYDATIASRRCVIAVTRIGMLNCSSAMWPCDSPNGPSGSRYSVSISPSMTISASAGTRRSTVFARTTRIGSPASPPATPISSTSSGNFIGAT